MISADSHITEPPDTYIDHIDPAFRDRAPQMIDHEKLGDMFVIDGMSKPISLLDGRGRGQAAEEIRSYGVEVRGAAPRRLGPDARLADQDRDGVAAEIIYPTVGMVLCNHPDLDYKQACFEAYNRWIAEYCSRASRPAARPGPDRDAHAGGGHRRPPRDQGARACAA